MNKCPKCGAELNQYGACSNFMQCSYVGSSAFDNYQLEESVSAELNNNLVIVNETIKRMGLKQVPQFYVLGGAALVFHGLHHPSTLDIDTANKISEEVADRISMFISDGASEVVKLGNNYKARAVRFKENVFDAIEVYLLSQEDLVLTKLISDRNKDSRDLKESGLLTKRNIEKAKNILLTEYEKEFAKKYLKMLEDYSYV